MMKILIVEDELLIAEMLKEMLFDLGYNTVYIAKNYKEAELQLMMHKNIQLAFLDINLTDAKSGIDVAQYIKTKHKIPFVYITSYSDPKTVKEATLTLPDAYLLKPFTKTALFSTLEMIKARCEINPSRFITFKEGNSYVKIAISEFLFVKSEKNYLNIFTTTKRHVVRQSIENFILEVDSPKLMRIHRSFAVNINRIDEVSGQHVKIQDYIIPLSRKYKKAILSHF